MSFRLTRRAALGACFSVWLIAVWWTAITSFAHNPQSPGVTAERRTRLVLPEGWGFFTRDPREADLIVARPEDDGQWEFEPPHASARNLFGLQRRSRAIPVESSRILTEGKVAFEPCEREWRRCLAAATPQAVVNDSPTPLLCGPVAFVRRAPVPWAWTDLMTPDEVESLVALTEIRCTHADTTNL